VPAWCEIPSPFGARLVKRDHFDMRLRSPTAILILAFLAMAVASCANIIHGKTEEISVESDPAGATVVLNNGMSGVTPFMIQVPRERDLIFHYSLDGYHPTEVVDDTTVESKYITVDWISMLFTGVPFAWLSDVSSGAAHTHETLVVSAQLQPDPSFTPRPSATATPTPLATPSAMPTATEVDQ
jgi:hypothetical protein